MDKVHVLSIRQAGKIVSGDFTVVGNNEIHLIVELVSGKQLVTSLSGLVSITEGEWLIAQLYSEQPSSLKHELDEYDFTNKILECISRLKVEFSE